MTDIAKRLREAAAMSLNEYGEADKYREAADEIKRLTVALEIIAGRRQCLDNLMSNAEVACAALDGGKP